MDSLLPPTAPEAVQFLDTLKKRRYRAPGSAAERLRSSDTFEERLAKRIEDMARADSDAVFARMAPKGRPPFSKQLTKAEQQEKMLELAADPQKLAAVRQQIAVQNIDERERRAAEGRLLRDLAKAQIASLTGVEESSGV